MINRWVGLAVAAGLGWFLISKPSRALKKGQAYRATYQLSKEIPRLTTEGDALEKFAKKMLDALPSGAGVEILSPDTFVFTFIAPASATIADIPLPIGKLELKTLEAL